MRAHRFLRLRPESVRRLGLSTRRGLAWLAGLACIGAGFVTAADLSVTGGASDSNSSPVTYGNVLVSGQSGGGVHINANTGFAGGIATVRYGRPVRLNSGTLATPRTIAVSDGANLEQTGGDYSVNGHYLDGAVSIDHEPGDLIVPSGNVEIRNNSTALPRLFRSR